MHNSGAVPGPAMLFCPADHPRRFSKAASCADAVILDLEDAVAPEGRGAARAAVAASSLAPETTIVRISPAGTPEAGLDLTAVADTPYRRVMLAKTESAAQLDALRRRGLRRHRPVQRRPREWRTPQRSPVTPPSRH